MHYTPPHEPEISAVTPLMAVMSENWTSLPFNSEFFSYFKRYFSN